MGTTIVRNEDIWIMVLSTIRYSMGRMTYMSQVAPEMYFKYKAGLTLAQRKQILEEVRDEIERSGRLGRTLGMQCDHDSWVKFVEDLTLELGSPVQE